MAYLLAPRVNWVPLQHPGYAAYSQPYTQLSVIPPGEDSLSTKKMTNARYRMPVLLPLHDVEVPEHLSLYKERGVRVITATRLNSRQIYMVRLEAESPPTTGQLRKRRDVMESFAAEQKCPECQKQIVLDKEEEPRCIGCQMILYPPPSVYLTHLAGSYLDARRARAHHRLDMTFAPGPFGRPN